jgi:hypothetical protein
MAKFTYLGTKLAKRIASRGNTSWLNFGNACYRTVQNLLSSRLLCKNVTINSTKL